MGRNNKKYHKSLHQQAYDKLTAMQAFGESKKVAKTEGTDKDKIFSYSTYTSYWKHIKLFIKFVQENHPECTTLKAAKQHINKWLQTRVDANLSAWTVHLENAALCKLYGIDKDDPNRFTPPPRRREDIMRSHTDAKRDAHFSEKNNAELVRFCKGTGLRRAGLESIRGRDLMTSAQIDSEIARIEAIPVEQRSAKDQTTLSIYKDAKLFDFPGQEYFVHTTEKGGKERIAPIIGPNVDQIIARFKAVKPDERVWRHVHTGADIHGYRAEYAKELYRTAERNATPEQASRLYCCRRDLAGLHLQRHALFLTSKALGHSRLDVAVLYVRGI